MRMKLFSSLLSGVTLMIGSFPIAAAAAPGKKDDLAPAIARGQELARAELDAATRVASLKGVQTEKIASDKEMAPLIPIVQSYEGDCGKAHPFNSKDPADMQRLDQCQARLAELKPIYLPAKKNAEAVNAKLASIGIGRDQLDGWQAALTAKLTAATAAQKMAESNMRQWRVDAHQLPLSDVTAACMRGTAVAKISDIELVEAFKGCADPKATSMATKTDLGEDDNPPVIQKSPPRKPCTLWEVLKAPVLSHECDRKVHPAVPMAVRG